MVSFSVIFQFVVVFLVPMIPSVFLFYVMPPKRVNATIQGAIFGFSVKAGGATAAYCLLTLLSGYIFNSVSEKHPQDVEGHIIVSVSGIDKDVANFFNGPALYLGLHIYVGDILLPPVVGFHAIPGQRLIISDGFKYPAQYDDHAVSVRLTPDSKTYKLVVPPNSKLTANIPLEISVMSTTGDWITALDLNMSTFGKKGRTAINSQIFIIDNRTPSNLSTIYFTPTEIGSIVKAHMVVRKISQGERESIIADWGGRDIEDLGAEVLRDKFVKLSEKVQHLGGFVDDDTITSEELTNISNIQIRDPNKTARYMSGIIPRVTFGSRPIRSNESVVVKLDIERREKGEKTQFKVGTTEPERLGRRYLYTTEKAVFIIAWDETMSLRETGEIEYLGADGRTDDFGNAMRSHPKTKDMMSLVFSNVPSNSFFLLPTYWDSRE